jgi:hypothetical protein
MARTHVVLEGETLESIAAAQGFHDALQAEKTLAPASPKLRLRRIALSGWSSGTQPLARWCKETVSLGSKHGDRNPNDAARQTVVAPITIAGVTAELRAFLIAAQRDIFQGYAGRQAQRGEPVSQKGFVDYCGVIGPHKAFQPRDGKHKKGSAIDIDPKFNPWTVTGKDPVSPPFSSETPANFRTGGDTATNRAALETLRVAAMTAYENALKFTLGTKTMDLRFRDPNGTPDPGEETFERYDRVNRALRVYMNCGFVPTKNNSLKRTATATPRTPNDARDTILNLMEAGFFEGGDTPSKANDPAFVQQFLADVTTDYNAMRRVCIYGSWTLDSGVQTFDSSRDPCYGIMSHRRHVVRGLLEVQIQGKRLRWGAVHFGRDQSGDMMHFDIGPLADKLQSTTEPNPNGIFFAA